MSLKQVIENAKRFLKKNKELANDIEAYCKYCKTIRKSWYLYRSAYGLIKALVNTYEKED